MIGYGFGYDEEVPRGFQDADLEMREWQEKAEYENDLRTDSQMEFERELERESRMEEQYERDLNS